MDPFDVLVFNAIAKSGGSWTMNPRDYIANQLGTKSDEVEVSFDNLARLGLITFDPASSTRMWPL
jgi:hypothetical protein